MEQRDSFTKKLNDHTINFHHVIQENVGLSSLAYINTKQNLFKTNNEASIFVDVDYQTIISQSGLEALLGGTFPSENLNVLKNRCHTDDKMLVAHICMTYFNYCSLNVLAANNTGLNFTCRIEKEKGQFIKVLCQLKVFEIHDQRITKLLVNFTNISFVSSQSNVAWTLQADLEQRLQFKRNVASKFKKLFTPREIDIIKQMQKGYNNQEIGEKLFISHLTVATHRKRIFNKANCHSAIEVLTYCRERGIL